MREENNFVRGKEIFATLFAVSSTLQVFSAPQAVCTRVSFYLVLPYFGSHLPAGTGKRSL
jgi:hypothetical protein